MRFKIIITSLLLIAFSILSAQDKKESDISLSGLKFRSIGPSVASGRIADIAVNPNDFSERYIAVASGNVWKSTNAGITWEPIFDNYASYSTSDVEIDPNNPNIIWVGTGEYNSQRAIGFGDGVYVSFDRGKSFKNVGLKASEHIGRIAIDPRNSDVYVASQGPLWGKGGERGLYKTSNYGETWDKILDISEHTGINDILIDPNNPDILYASSYQRRRHVFTLIDGGEEATIYKSIDAGKTWKKIESGLPSKKMGRIGIAMSPVNSNYIYAIVEAQETSGGFFRSTDGGASWNKMSDYVSASPQYYNRIYCDPVDLNKVYSMDTYSRYSLDGGKTWIKFGLKEKHVDDHCIWINPNDTKQIMIGNDGGLYETFDFGENWRHIENLPITQFYRVETDNDYPFYNVYGGTQDNNTLGGPSRTKSGYGIINGDWFSTVGGDGFQSRVDPKDPNTVYSQAQYGWLVRYNKLNGEKISIQPQAPVGEAYRWNWNAPLLISPHNNHRLYFAANKVFRSDDRGNNWTVISPDLTHQLDRNQFKVMDEIQSPEAVAKNASTSLYGNIVSLDESSLVEGFIVIGTDDGLIHITEDGGKIWKRAASFKGVKTTTYVSSVRTSAHNENVIYATLDGRKNNDFGVYVFKSSDRGKSWVDISNNIPEKQVVHTIVEDHKKQGLLFIGTEFGIFFSHNDGQKWQQLKNGIPTIPVRDISIQKREDDLVLATFGRGFYIMDNYDPLRHLDKVETSDYQLLPVKPALQFVKTGHLYGQGATYYKGENPPMAVTFTYYVKDKVKSLKDIRKEKNAKLKKDGKDIVYPDFDALSKEDRERKSYLVFVIKNSEGKIIRQLTQAVSTGLQRLNWDMRLTSKALISKAKEAPFKNKQAQLALPGQYSVSLFLNKAGEWMDLNQTQNFEIVAYPNYSKELHKEMFAFQEEINAFNTKYSEFINVFKSTKKQLKKMQKAYYTASKQDAALYQTILDCQNKLDAIDILINGNPSISKRNGNQEPSIGDRFGLIRYSVSSYTGAPTGTLIEQFKIVKEQFALVESDFNKIKNEKLEHLKEGLKAIGAANISQ